MKILLIASAVLLFGCVGFAQSQPQLNLMPMPSSVQLGAGQLRIDRSFSATVTGSRDGRLERGVARFLRQLARETGIPISPNRDSGAKPTLTIHAAHEAQRVQQLGEDESYELVVGEAGATLNAPNTLGILHGLQTFLELVQVSPNGFAVPALTIKDQPRFPWRGLLIDVGRHFIPLDFLKRNVDGMEAVKMNVLHWHLYDHEGFRIESKKFPKLQEDGSDGQYYTQEQIREFVAYAYDRGIRVMPEFEMPGHSSSMFVGYPKLASGPGPYKLEPGGPPTAMDPTREDTYKFLEKFLDEMTKLFPDQYVHIGGDEVDPRPWNTNPKIQEFMHAHGMKDVKDLQAYFNQRVEKILSKQHKTMMGWDEVLHPELPKSIVVQSWRGAESLATAAQQGYNTILSFGYYLDLMWPASRHYAMDPISGAAAALSPEQKRRILGGEACMWGEWIVGENIDSRVWPRNAPIAERLWSPAEVQDPTSMYARMDDLSWKLQRLGLTHRSSFEMAMRRMAGTDDIESLETLADVVEPVKDYTRMDSLKTVWDFRAPLNRLVDFVPPESDEGRLFQEWVQTYIRSGYKDQASAEHIRSSLMEWRNNDAKLQPVLNRSFLTQELAPLSTDLAAMGSAGLSAMDCLEKSLPCTEQWRTQQLSVVEGVRKPKADLLLTVASPVQQLIEASAMADRR